MARCTICEYECNTERVITLARQPFLFDSIACVLATPTLVCLHGGGKIVEYGVNTQDARCWCTTHTQACDAELSGGVVIERRRDSYSYRRFPAICLPMRPIVSGLDFALKPV